MPLALPPVLRVGVGVAVTVVERERVLEELSDPDGVCDGVIDDVPVPLPVLDDVGVTERLDVEVVLSVPLSEPVLDGLAPLVTEAVGVRDTDRDRESVDVAVSLDVGVTLAVPEPVDVGESLLLGVFDGDAPCVTVVVGVFDVEDESDGVFDVDDESDGADELVCTGVPAPDGMSVADTVKEGVGVDRGDAV